MAAPARKGLNPLIFVAIGVALVLMLGACGVGWLLFLRPMDAATYEDRVTESVISTADAVTTLGEAFSDMDTDYDEAIGNDNLSMLRDAAAEAVDGVSAARSDIDSLRPPKEYERSHKLLITSYDEMLDGLGVLEKMLGDMTADDTTNSIEERFARESESFTAKLEASSADMQEALEDMGLYESLSDRLSTMF